jgi:hypothetical protein
VPAIAELESLIGLVACGFGFTVLSSPFEHIAPPTVVFKAIAVTARPAEVLARWRTDEKNPLIENFLAIAQRAELIGSLAEA